MLTSRSGTAGHSAPPPPQSIEAVRRRARHRLIGAAVLVLVGVLGFPLLFDTQPRPVAVDIPIEIPSRASTPSPSARAEPGAPAVAGKGTAVAASDSLGAREEVMEVKPANPKPAAEKPSAGPAEKLAAKAAEKPADKPQAKPADKTTDKVADKPADKASGNERIVVQVGAFAEVDRAREARLKLERAGLKTYTHVADTPQGKRIRVRVGPFASRAEADKAAERAKAAGLPATLLWL
jgi:DedD protein